MISNTFNQNSSIINLNLKLKTLLKQLWGYLPLGS